MNFSLNVLGRAVFVPLSKDCPGQLCLPAFDFLDGSIQNISKTNPGQPWAWGPSPKTPSPFPFWGPGPGVHDRLLGVPPPPCHCSPNQGVVDEVSLSRADGQLQTFLLLLFFLECKRTKDAKMLRKRAGQNKGLVKKSTFCVIAGAVCSWQLQFWVLHFPGTRFNPGTQGVSPFSSRPKYFSLWATAPPPPGVLNTALVPTSSPDPMRPARTVARLQAIVQVSAGGGQESWVLGQGCSARFPARRVDEN